MYIIGILYIDRIVYNLFVTCVAQKTPIYTEI